MNTLTQADLQQIKKKGFTVELIQSQINKFKQTQPNLIISEVATTEKGIIKLDYSKSKHFCQLYEDLGKDKTKVKFVPASGAASRMFKDLFDVLNNYSANKNYFSELKKKNNFGSPYYIIKNINKFAFFSDLKECIKKNGGNLDSFINENEIVNILEFLLTAKGLNYGNLPKGLVKFHKTKEGDKTAFEEHLTEGALYANSGKYVNIHFTISEQHLPLFKDLLNNIEKKYSVKYNKKYNISFSKQQNNTDTIAVDSKNNAVRDEKGKLLFRPGGHGSLIYNLNNIDADIIFIKNIDNILPEEKNNETIFYKKVLGGILLETQSEIFKLINKLNNNNCETITEASKYIQNSLNIILPTQFNNWDLETKTKFLLKKLNRPLRICGMVKNMGEPGGGPFWVQNTDESISLQILEKSQIPKDKIDIINNATHFNPVDIVCSTKNFKNRKFNLHNFIDPNTYFISEKYYKGKNIKAIEHPGLWNGAMSDWNTIFVEVPLYTFSPVKTVGDLLKEDHL